ncbi:DUF2142 domain-containing protein [Leifsonia sp. NPDC058292]|uniref:DUF2142 domain-containing protein n=1 Tax=Leifsonia sp. NPDC058292 TaxID=3346428 RepID=UPI0036D804BB
MIGLTKRIGRSTWMTGLLVFVGLMLMSGTWAVTTPLSASPDEPSHIIKAAAVVRGELIGTPTERSGRTDVTVPDGIARVWKFTCTAFSNTTPAGCMGAIEGGSAKEVTAETSAGLYNPIYYALVGWPTLITSHSFAAVFSMRLLTGLICSALLAIAFSALFLLRRSAVTGFAALAVVTPMTLFLSGSVNPNAIEIASGTALLALLLLLVRGPALPRPGWALALVAVSGVLLANTRGLSPLWMVLIAVIALVAAAPGRVRELFRRPSAWVALVVLALGGGFATVWILATNTLASMGHYGGAGDSPTLAFATMLLDKTFDNGLIGLFGWVDTAAPGYAYWVWSFLSLATVLAAVIVARGRLLAAVLIAVGGFLFIPAAVQAASVQSSGYIWQGRYSLIAYAAVMVVSAVAIVLSDTSRIRVPRALIMRGVIIVGALVAIGQTYSIMWVLRRYAVGIHGSWSGFLKHPQWHAPGSNVLWIVAGLIGAIVVSYAWVARSSSEPLTRTEAGSESTDSPGYPAEAR